MLIRRITGSQRVGPILPPTSQRPRSLQGRLLNLPILAERTTTRTADTLMRQAAAIEGEQPQASTAEPVQIDRDSFKGTFSVLALRVPNQKCSDLRGALRDHLLARAKLRPIIPDPSSNDMRLLCLSGDYLKAEDLTKLPEDLRKMVEGLETVHYEYPVDYSVFSAEEVLRRLLPPGLEIPQGFETIGHIAHFNLKPEHLPFKALIARVVLDKNPGIKTVVNKLGNIENEFRVLPMELLGGEDTLDAVVKQHGCQFHLNFAEVYWNSRLETEHRRLVDTFKQDEVVADMMGGIGPFGVPAAKHGCKVLCNDLNPRSVHWLRINMKRNKLEKDGRLGCFNLDGREFIHLLCGHVSRERFDEIAAQGLLPPNYPFPTPGAGVKFDHVIMNLPASAVEFLDTFRNVFPPATWAECPLPLVHCYTFARGEGDEARQAAIAAVEHHLGGKLEAGSVQAHVVRDVAPNKLMFCVSFRVPKSIGLVKEGGASSLKRPREEDEDAAGKAST